VRVEQRLIVLRAMDQRECEHVRVPDQQAQNAFRLLLAPKLRKRRSQALRLLERPLCLPATFVTDVRNVGETRGKYNRGCLDKPHLRFADGTTRRGQDKVRARFRGGRHMISHGNAPSLGWIAPVVRSQAVPPAPGNVDRLAKGTTSPSELDIGKARRAWGRHSWTEQAVQAAACHSDIAFCDGLLR